MQREQGFDMEAYCGKRCEQYSYLLTNYPDCGESVIITIYIIDGKVIAGDIHTAALDGFMHGIIREMRDENIPHKLYSSYYAAPSSAAARSTAASARVIFSPGRKFFSTTP